MSEVVLNFAEEPGEDHICTREGDLPVPRVGERVHLDREYRVDAVLYDLASEDAVPPEVWITVEPTSPDPNPEELPDR
ncbi:hypothetical protein SAMN05443574_13510 [Haloarcula vallismortis]|uniref:Uncharacterized protein n=2 Tax=Haloarcula vallismortis TaxID=28442 RepID=M0J971_HALVA|nr:hypothetical protein [Haloarcula vallismortis]EMA04285.1 hypothetical protein C437_14032 [Haloarcula vallismortis ATCC 29715]SDX35409.1 hypothetical protein SAMN05443574_13510 [Haloarcula vallismortis]